MITENHKIFVYSTDLDLCNSISLLLQSKYQIRYTTNSINIEDVDVDLLIIDVPISDGNLLSKIKRIKTKYPKIKILLLYIYKMNETQLEAGYRKYSDFLLYKPIDVSQLTMAVDNLIVEKNKELLSNKK